jgi:hypothetical protein
MANRAVVNIFGSAPLRVRLAASKAQARERAEKEYLSGFEVSDELVALYDQMVARLSPEALMAMNS